MTYEGVGGPGSGAGVPVGWRPSCTSPWWARRACPRRSAASSTTWSTSAVAWPSAVTMSPCTAAAATGRYRPRATTDAAGASGDGGHQAHLDAIVHSMTSTAKALVAGADIVHYHGIGPGLVAPLPRFLSQAKVVLTVHGLDHQRAKWGTTAQTVLGSAHWMSGRVPDRVIVVSRDLQQHYRTQFGRNAQYIPNGGVQGPRVPAESLPMGHGLEPGRYALHVGRLVPEKRADLLIEAFRRVPATTSSPSWATRLSPTTTRAICATWRPRTAASSSRGSPSVTSWQRCTSTRGCSCSRRPRGPAPHAARGRRLRRARAGVRHPPAPRGLGEGSARHRMVPVDSVDALAGALTQMLEHPRPHDARSRAWREGVLARHSWDAATDLLEQLYLQATGRRGESGAVTTRGSSGTHAERPRWAAS